MKKLVFSSVLLFTMLFFNSCGVFTSYPNSTGSTRVVSPVSNPFYQLADVQLVGCYGNSASATVEFIFTVTSRSNVISRGTFGAYPSKFAARGQAYSPYKSAGTSVELVRYAPADVVITLHGVPDYLTQFDRVELTWYFTSSHHSGSAKQDLIFNYVPINWN